MWAGGGILLMVDERPDMIKVLLDISVLVGQSLLVMNGHLNWKASERKDRPCTSYQWLAKITSSRR
jgi:hypothetical protein